MSDAPWRVLCQLSDVPDGRARGLLREDGDDLVFVVRRGEQVFVWLNDCPHNHRPLEYKQDQFLSADGGHIVCYAHSAHFDIESGHCFAGPCEGQHLVAVPARIVEGQVLIPAELPSIFD